MYGGGVAVDSCDVTFRDCLFTGNHATVEGGGLNYWHGTPDISGCDFFNNDAVYSGGGFVLNYTDGSVSDCTVSGNESQWGGGAAVYHNATTYFYDCAFIENNAPGEESYGAGFYTWNGAAPVLDQCVFTENTSEFCGGGACSDDNCTAVFIGCSFSGNSARYGGGLYVWEPAGGSVTDCTFLRNTAESGGGVLLEGVDNMPVADCWFQDNVASIAGGGLTLEECGSGASDCLFTGNTAMWGGAIAADFCTATTLADGCTIVLNQTAGAMGAGGGIAVNAGAPTRIVRCIVAFGTLGGAVYCEDGGAVTADECVVFGNVGGDWVDCLSGQEAQNYNSDADPLFCDMLNENFYLCENSYCLPSNNTPAVQIGVYTAGCDACGSPVEMKSWGGIKAMYR
jgi:hypothetical protein